MADVIDPLKYTIDALIAQGSPEAFKEASKLAKQTQISAAAAGPFPATVAPAPGPDGLTEGVDYWSHADLSAMTGAQMQRVVETERPKLEESMRHLTTSTRGRTYRGG
jgi:hypothetical protein